MTTNHHYKSFMRRSVVLSFIVGVFAGVSVSGSVSAASSTKVTWKISSLSAGEVKKLSAMASTNSPGVKTWSKSGTCTLTPKRKPTNLTMGATGSCDLILKIAKSKNYPARTSRKTITLITPAATVALERTYAVGETGPGGGIVFYDAGTAQPWGRYLEAAPTDYQVNGVRARVSWGCDGMPGGKTSTGIGTGLANTSTMLSRGLSKCTTSGIAAEVANKYRTCTDGRSSTSEDAVCPFTGLGQWFLPSKDELKLMYDNRVAIGGFSADYNYWSSSEDDENIAWAQSFSSGSQRYSEKYSNYYVRPVRAFFAPTSTTTPTTAPSSILGKCAIGGRCSVGDTGPGGGIVFYDAGTTQTWGRYLEAAPTDYQVKSVRAIAEWGCRNTPTGGTATAIGTGKTNTATILAKCTTAGIAADVAVKYSTNTAAAGQWFLPSKDELTEMYFNRATIGGFVADSYWSSSERIAEYSWFQIFVDGAQYGLSKDSTAYVRPVRAF